MFLPLVAPGHGQEAAPAPALKQNRKRKIDKATGCNIMTTTVKKSVAQCSVFTSPDIFSYDMYFYTKHGKLNKSKQKSVGQPV